MNDLFDQAMQFRSVAKKMHALIGRTMRCECVETPEYAKYQRERSALMKKMSPEERMLFWIFNDFEGKKLEKECDRCLVMFEYETLIGDEGVELEYLERLEQKKL